MHENPKMTKGSLDEINIYIFLFFIFNLWFPNLKDKNLSFPKFRMENKFTHWIEAYTVIINHQIKEANLGFYVKCSKRTKLLISS